MATRSLIGMQVDSGIKYIYCHWDGYPSYNGKILLDCYLQEDQVKALLELGHLSVLGLELGEKQAFNKPKSGWCVAYGRDRGETDTQAYLIEDEDMFGSLNDGSEYKYLYKGGKWYMTDGHQPFVELTHDMCQE